MYKCEHCGKEYSSQGWLDKHLEAHENEGQEERPFHFPEYKKTILARTQKEAESKLFRGITRGGGSK